MSLAAAGLTVAGPGHADEACPQPTSTQGVESTNGTFTVSAKVEIKPTLWVANGGQDTVSKIATDVNKESARYTTAFWNGGIGGAGAGLPSHSPWYGPAPSRSAVDTDGNAYIANRGFGRVAEVVKILSTGCIDRNNNGTCETSSDLNGNGNISANEMYPIVDNNGNGTIDDNEIRDERVAWIRKVGTHDELARGLAIDKQGFLWIGMYNTMRIYKMDPATGAVLGNWSIGVRPYGAAVDSKNRIFTASLNGANTQKRIDATNPTTQAAYNVSIGYGMAIGKDHTGKEWVVTAHHSNFGFMRFDPDTLASAFPMGSAGYSPLGISFDKDGHLVMSSSQYAGQRGAAKVRTDGSVIWTRPAPAGCDAGDQRGAIVDANNDVWIVSMQLHKVCKYLANGNYSAQVAVGTNPYTYSDASGIGLQFSDPTGKVVFQSDAVGPDFNWAGAPVCFNGSGDVKLSAAAANTQAGLGFANPASVALTQNGAQLCGTIPAGVQGRYIELTFTIKIGGSVTITDQSTGTCTIDLPEANKAPVAACSSPAVCANEMCVGAANINAGSYDPDGDALNYSASPDGPYTLGQTLVSLSVSDGKATATCQGTVTVNDCTAPAISCPQNVVAECTGGGAATVNPGEASAQDNCGVPSVTQAGTASFALGTTAVSYSASDAAGNTNACSSTVTVQDTTAPTLACPAASTIECTGNAGASFTPAAAVGSDTCTSASVSNAAGGFFALGTHTLSYSAADQAGNSSECASSVTVQDTTAPSLTCPAASTVECTGNNGASFAPAAAEASDVCTSASVSNAAGGFFALGTHTLAYSAADQAGNAAQCSSSVTVADTTPPVVSAVGGGQLWPPNHKYVTVSLADCGIAVQDVCNGSMSLTGAQAAITCVSSDEVEDTSGDGKTTKDIIVVNGTTVQLRAERDGDKDGRVYSIGFAVKDGSGNVTNGTCKVTVPHSQGPKGVAVDSGAKYTVCK